MNDQKERPMAIKLVKRKVGGLGFLVKERPIKPHVAISDIVKGSSAEENGMLRPGDVVLEVNGKSVEEASYEKVLEILSGISTGSSVVLKIRAKDGCQASLETTFSEAETGKTVRLTRDANASKSKSGPATPATPQKENGTQTEKRKETEIQEKPVAYGEAGKVLNGHATPVTNKESSNRDVINDNNNSTSSQSVPAVNPTAKCPLSGFRESSKSPKFIKLTNWVTGKQMTDTLHQKAQTPLNCTSARCEGSMMRPYGGETPTVRPYGVPRHKEEVNVQAEDFIEQYYTSMKLAKSPAHEKRLAEVMKAIEETGTYDLTEKELMFGARMAWRNAARCIGRIQWNRLHLFDARDVFTNRGMFDAIIKHIKYGTNKGNIRSTITVFPQRKDPHKDFRVWNGQILQYAGYRQPDGSIIGDPAGVELTEICISLGWEPKKGRFDILPLILQAGGEEPELFEIPPELVLEVKIKHPRHKWFEELGLQWYALPAVSCLCLDVGGVEFPGCPFNGWYMVTEVGARDLGDQSRYNMFEPVAKKMGLDTRSNASLWKDQACVELNVAVLYSFQEAGVTMTDHHSAAESFIKHFENETKLRGGCPSDWVWVVPPISGSITPVFHQEMLNYSLKPSYEYQDDPWKHYRINKKEASADSTKKKPSFKEVAKAVKFSAKLMGKAMAKRTKAIILYATETGKSESYARMLSELFLHAFDPKVMCMDEYPHPELENEQLVVIVTSTFGNGDPPENGESFARYLYELRHPTIDGAKKRKMKSLGSLLMQKEKEKGLKIKADEQPLASLRYSVFGLGSRAYPNFCAFARSVDKIIQVLGGEQMLKIGEGDELCGQEESFKTWAKNVFKAACETFCVGEDVNTADANESLNTLSSGWSPGRYRFTKDSANLKDVCTNLSSTNSKTISATKVICITNLQSQDSSRSTILARLETKSNPDFRYQPGDHLSIFPANRKEHVQALLDKLCEAPDPDQPIKVEVCHEVSGPFGTTKKWETLDRLPVPVTLREAFSRFIDITGTPTPQILNYLATQATNPKEKEKLEIIGKGDSRYEDWRYDKQANIVEVLQDFPSVKAEAALLLTQLPLMQPRFYSISSSQDMYPGEVHVTVAVVQFTKRGGQGPVHHGVCSTWLNSLKPGDTVPCFVRLAHSFRLPEDSTVPVIMVGPGTGIAPFRSFWQQRQYDLANKPLPFPKSRENSPEVSPKGSPEINRRIHNEDVKETHLAPESPITVCRNSPRTRRRVSSTEQGFWGNMVLYFGCRSSKQDDIYKHDTGHAKEDGALTNVRTALSREPNQPKYYVQDLLKEDALDIVDMLMSQNAHFYTCGDVSMAADVSRTLQTMLEAYAAMSQQEAQDFLDKLKNAGRYHEDIFGVTLRTREVTDRVRTAARKAWVYIATSKKVKKASLAALTKDGLKQDFTKQIKMSAHHPQFPRKYPLDRGPTLTVLMRTDEEVKAEKEKEDIAEEARNKRRSSLPDVSAST